MKTLALLSLRETGSIANWLAPYLFHLRRPLYWDTLLGVGQIWLGRLPWSNGPTTPGCSPGEP